MRGDVGELNTHCLTPVQEQLELNTHCLEHYHLPRSPKIVALKHLTKLLRSKDGLIQQMVYKKNLQNLVIIPKTTFELPNQGVADLQTKFQHQVLTLEYKCRTLVGLGPNVKLQTIESDLS